MLEAYRVGVTLTLTNLVSPMLMEIGRDFKKLDALAISVQKSLKLIGAESTALRAVARAGDATGLALEKANVHAAALEKHLVAIKSAGTLPALIPVAPRGGANGSGGKGHQGSLHVGAGGVRLSTAKIGLGEVVLPAAGAAVEVVRDEKAFA